MDYIDNSITRIIGKIHNSSLSDTEKADVLSELSAGMRHLVWPILLSHVPEYLLKEAMDKKSMTVDDYVEIIQSSLQNPATAKEIHDELKEALLEVEALVGV